jgi:hypothetical protein
MARQRKKRIGKGSKRRVSYDDITMLLKVAETYNTDYDFQATEWFWSDDEFGQISSYEEFKSRYPHGSKGAQLFVRFTSKFELAGIVAEYGFLNENLYFDRYGALQIEWKKAKPIVYGLRKEWDEPRFRENFELLSTRGKEWLESHPPKINNNNNPLKDEIF